MEICFATLCDSATVREGLLHLLGGGITRVYRTPLPAPLGVALALMIRIPQDVAELRLPHEIQVTVLNDAGMVNQGMGAFQTGELPPRIEPGESLLVPFVMPVNGVAIFAHGRHWIDVSVDNGEPTHLEFWVLHPDELAIPPIGPSAP